MSTVLSFKKAVGLLAGLATIPVHAATKYLIVL
jgi:hypothetical protein